jgi:hypothetical protein
LEPHEIEIYLRFFFHFFREREPRKQGKTKTKIKFFIFFILIIEKFLSEGGLWAAWWCEFVYIYSPVSTWFPPYFLLLHILS